MRIFAFGVFSKTVSDVIISIEPNQFVEGIDLHMMYMDMYPASEGYLWEKSHQGKYDAEKVEQDFERLMDFRKKIYLRKEH